MKIRPVTVELHVDRKAGVKLPADFSNSFVTEPNKSLRYRKSLEARLKVLRSPSDPRASGTHLDSSRAL